MNIGDTIISYDFHFRRDCYMIGRIIGIDDYRGTINCKSLMVVFRGANKDLLPDEEFTTPMQGQMMDDKDFERVVLIGTADSEQN